MSIARLLDRPIAYHRCLVTLTGSVTGAVMLSQAIYWQNRCNGDFYKTQQEWEEETGLSRREQETARKALAALSHDDQPLWSEKRQGLPAKIFYRVDLGVLEDLLQSSMADSANLDCTKAPISDGGKRQSFICTESTTETTTEREKESSFPVLSPPHPDPASPPQAEHAAPTPQQLFFKRVCWVVGWNHETLTASQRGQVAQAIGVLSKAGYTEDSISQWWDAVWKKDFRWRQHHSRPTLTQLRAEIGKLDADQREQETEEKADSTDIAALYRQHMEALRAKQQGVTA